jgi:hypothetical protein
LPIIASDKQELLISQNEENTQPKPHIVRKKSSKKIQLCEDIKFLAHKIKKEQKSHLNWEERKFNITAQHLSLINTEDATDFAHFLDEFPSSKQKN